MSVWPLIETALDASDDLGEAIEAINGSATEVPLEERRSALRRAEVASDAAERAAKEAVERLEREHVEVIERLTTFVDEAFGLHPVMTHDDLLTTLDREYHARRIRETNEQTRLEREHAVLLAVYRAARACMIADTPGGPMVVMGADGFNDAMYAARAVLEPMACGLRCNKSSCEDRCVLDTGHEGPCSCRR